MRQALLTLFAQHGSEGIALLRDLTRQSDRSVAQQAAGYLRELKIADPVEDFRTFIRSLKYELESGALLLSRAVNPDLDVGACCARLDALAARCRELIAEPASAREKCRIVNRVLWHEQGFSGNTDHFTDPRNSFLDQVLIRRKGIPISLSTVYLLVADRAGLQLEPVALPGHFLVGCYEETLPFFVDPFNAGTFLTAGEVFLMAKKSVGQAALADLAPTPVREVLCRYCRNLAQHFQVEEQPENARLFASFVAEFESTYERHAQS